MRRINPLWLSSVGLLAALTATAVVARVAAGHGEDLGEIMPSILTSLYPDELVPRLIIAAFVGLGGYLLIRKRSRRSVLALALACAVTGVIAGAIIVVQAEMAFYKALPNGGAGLGWAPGAARAELLPVNYLVAWIQVSVGLMASTLLIALSDSRRRVQT